MHDNHQNPRFPGPEHPRYGGPEHSTRTPAGKKGRAGGRDGKRQGTSRQASRQASLKEQDAELLEHLFSGASLRDAADRMDRAVSTVHERAAKLAREGFLEKATDAPNARWQLTARGLGALSIQPTGGSEAQTRTPPMRGHRFAVVAELEETPSPELVDERLPAGWTAYRMRGWRCWSGQWTVEEVTVPVQIRRRSAVLHVPPIEGLPAQTARRALEYAGKVTASVEAELGLRFGSSLRFEVPPEYAYPLHPVARWWVEQHGTGGALVPCLLWVDLSKGICELETDELALAEAIERAPRDGSVEPRRLIEAVLKGAGMGDCCAELPWRQRKPTAKLRPSRTRTARVDIKSTSNGQPGLTPWGVHDEA